MNIPEPSLCDLCDFINNNRDFFEDQEENRCVYAYMSDTCAKYSDGHYWLKGHLPMLPDEKITEEKIQKAIEIDKKRMIEYGGPCNGMEAASMNNHNIKFENLQKILKKYYELVAAELFRPPDETDPMDRGGDFYQQISKETQVGK